MLDPDRRQRLFGIGLNKTGTRSLADALRELGFRTLHRGDAAASDAVRRCIQQGRPPLEELGDDFDAYLDVHAIVEHFDVLDDAYPGARFVLTTRDEEAWLRSRRRHVEANRRRAEAGTYDGSWLEVDLPGWRRERHEHHERVRAHFEGRPDDLLEYDPTTDGWGPLVAFLSVPHPGTTFPHRNRAGEGTYAARSLRGELARVRRLALGRVRRARRRGATDRG